MDDNETNLVDETVAARIQGKAISTVRNDRHLHKGPPYIKLGRSIRYKLTDLLRYIDQHRIEPEG